MRNFPDTLPYIFDPVAAMFISVETSIVVSECLNDVVLSFETMQGETNAMFYFYLFEFLKM